MFLLTQVQSTVGSGVTAVIYKEKKQGGKHAGENLAILDRTILHKHGTLTPESLHAESQWDQPENGSARRLLGQNWVTLSREWGKGLGSSMSNYPTLVRGRNHVRSWYMKPAVT